MLFPATTLLVKMCLERSAERDKHEDKNKISAEDIRVAAPCVCFVP